jgi:hypothetical protein
LEGLHGLFGCLDGVKQRLLNLCCGREFTPALR